MCFGDNIIDRLKAPGGGFCFVARVQQPTTKSASAAMTVACEAGPVYRPEMPESARREQSRRNFPLPALVLSNMTGVNPGRTFHDGWGRTTSDWVAGDDLNQVVGTPDVLVQGK
jgi:hypothetical protein